MYAEFYGFREPPFNISPDPRFLYLNDCYQEALAALTYGIDARKGFLCLIGEAGTGKTTLLRRLLETLDPQTKTITLLNPTVGFDEILAHIMRELAVGVPEQSRSSRRRARPSVTTDASPPRRRRTPRSKLVQLQLLREFLVAHTEGGGNVALLIDEAQDLSPAALEELRLLSNLETERAKLVQIVLSGQPEIEATLLNPGLRQLRQRITLRARLRPLAASEVPSYVRRRLQCVAAPEPDLFTEEALDRIATLSHGIPRIINVLCDEALLIACVAQNRHVTPAIVDEAWRDYGLEPVPSVFPEPLLWRSTPAPARPPEDAASPAASSPLPVADPPAVAPHVPPPLAAPRPAPFVPPVPSPRPAPIGSTAGAGFESHSVFGFVVIGILALMLVAGHYLRPPAPIEDDGISLRGSDVASTPTPPPTHAAMPPPPPSVRPPLAAREEPLRPSEAPVSSAEATEVVEEFRVAYQERDVARLLRLFAVDAAENGRRGLSTIAAAYHAQLAALDEVRYTLASVAIEPHGSRADVRAPFIISYRHAQGAIGEIRGQAEWGVERRAGRPRIVALNYRLDPASENGSPIAAR